MPREIIKYLCDFKCGTKAKSTIPDINYHEKICFKNPARKTCSTCVHEIYRLDSDYTGSWMHRDCKNKNVDFDAAFKLCDYNSTPKFHVQPIHSCPHYSQKTT